VEFIHYKTEFLISLKETGRRESTIRRYQFDLNDFFNWSSVQEELNQYFIYTSENIQNYFSYLTFEKHYSHASIKRIRTVLNQYFNFLLNKNLCNNNPITSIIIDDQSTISFSSKDFITNTEIKQLLKTIQSPINLSERQVMAHQFLKFRNEAILVLFIQYGLSLNELTNLYVKSIDFFHNKLYIKSNSSLSRTLTISQENKSILYQYIHSIPMPVRPRPNSNDPFFVAFDFARNTYRWDYSVDKPKKLTEVAIQKMMRNELARANIRSEISAQHLRRTSIINALKEGLSPIEINKRFGFKANNSLSRYINYMHSIQKEKPKLRK
jgi:site-specific recombinase XerD